MGILNSLGATSFQRKMMKKFENIREDFPYLGYEYEMSYIKPDSEDALLKGIEKLFESIATENSRAQEVTMTNYSIDYKLNLTEEAIVSFLHTILGSRFTSDEVSSGYLYIAVEGKGIRKICVTLQAHTERGRYTDMSTMNPYESETYSLDFFTTHITDETKTKIITKVIKQSSSILNQLENKFVED